MRFGSPGRAVVLVESYGPAVYSTHHANSPKLARMQVLQLEERLTNAQHQRRLLEMKMVRVRAGEPSSLSSLQESILSSSTASTYAYAGAGEPGGDAPR
jgi:hypothetical protein